MFGCEVVDAGVELGWGGYSSVNFFGSEGFDFFCEEVFELCASSDGVVYEDYAHAFDHLWVWDLFVFCNEFAFSLDWWDIASSPAWGVFYEGASEWG